MQSSVLEIERPDVQAAMVDTARFQSIDEFPRILIADDDPWIVRLLVDHCVKLGFEVDTASDGIQAFLRARWDKPDILMIDLNMPELDGLTVCAHLLDADRAPFNLIVITGSRDPLMPQRCKGFGAYYARKGPDFWDDVDAALAEIHPE